MKHRAHEGKYYAFANAHTGEICQFWRTSKRQCRKQLMRWGSNPSEWRQLPADEANALEQQVATLYESCEEGGKQ